MAPLADEPLGASYRLVSLLGRGAAGEVWRAVDHRSGEAVAAKLLRPEHAADRELVGRFVRERSILTDLRHPGIVAVRDLVVEGDRLAIVMDLVEGGSLRDVLLRERTLAPAAAVEVVALVLDALAHAHARQVLHRDVKPDNVLVERFEAGADPLVRLTDFGIARLLEDGGGTTTGLVGTPHYMAPEMLVTGVADRPADVYAAGIVLHELLAGRSPFGGAGTDYSVAHRHVTSVPPPLDVPAPLAAELDRLLAKDPRARPTAAEAAQALRRTLPVLAGLPPLPPQAQPDRFEDARGPQTVVRWGEAPSGVGDPGPAAVPPAADAPPPELGVPAGATVLRPLARRSGTPPADAPAPAGARAARRPRHPQRRLDPRAVALVAGGAALVVGAVVVALVGGGDDDPAVVGTTPVRATAQAPTTPTGLTVRRDVVWDPQEGSGELTVTWSAQDAPLTGPFLEVLPDPAGDGCAGVVWSEPQDEDVPSVSGVSAPCGWSLDPGVVPARGSLSLTATVDLPLEGADGASALQAWVDGVAQSTDEALADPAVTGTAYAVQRLQAVELQAPPRSVSGRTLPLTVRPVWPGGPDELNVVYRSPAVGEPSTLLRAVAGGEEGLRFSDGCAGALSVSRDGLVVTALNVAAECEVLVRVGNLPEVRSNPVAIVTRGG